MRFGSQVARTIDDHYREAITLGNRVYTASHRGDHRLALSQGRAALELHRGHGHHNQVPWVSIALSGVLGGLGMTEKATVPLAAAEQAAQRMLLEGMPGDVGENAEIRRSLQEAAGDKFHQWYERGRSMSLDDALAILEHLD